MTKAKLFWTPEELALLGTDTDRKIAAMLDAPEGSVKRQRKELGIPSFKVSKPAPDFSVADTLFGRVSDAGVVRITGLSYHLVNQRRRQLGIAAFEPPAPPPKPVKPPIVWEPECDALIGFAPDGLVAARFGKSVRAVVMRRGRLGRAKYEAGPVDTQQKIEGWLVRMGLSRGEAAASLGVTESALASDPVPRWLALAMLGLEALAAGGGKQDAEN